ncbi:alpha/beta fold hydrolase [Dietzia psychralcaliphila]|uniref:alpha/beta fold hydrolase n=1 Tax=Dietzia psychralcaliphila TaxID=139021 RepID=UPI001C1E7CE4|nr:alpha/beta hydrolase [Dietzia psychralcaliphila]
MTSLVFLPGLHGDAQTWAPVVRALPDDLPARALDLPAEPDLDALADEVARQIAPGSVVVGHSLGGVVAMHLAERHPSLLAGLVLVTAPVGAEDPEAASARAARAANLSPEAYEEIALDGMEAVYYGDRGRDPQVRAERLRAARGYGPARFAAHSVAIGARPDRRDFPAQAPCPVLIVGASHDQVVPTEEQRRWAETNGAETNGAVAGGAEAGDGDAGSDRAANSARANSVTYAEIARTGHMLPVETPDELAAAISGWWHRTEA